jgi:hypothetical protein
MSGLLQDSNTSSSEAIFLFAGLCVDRTLKAPLLDSACNRIWDLEVMVAFPGSREAASAAIIPGPAVLAFIFMRKTCGKELRLAASQVGRR